MYKILNPPKHGEVGLCVPANGESGDAVYLLGVIVDNFDNVTNEMITVEVPEATYAVFTIPPVDTSNDLDNDDFPEAIKRLGNIYLRNGLKIVNMFLMKVNLTLNFMMRDVMDEKIL